MCLHPLLNFQNISRYSVATCLNDYVASIKFQLYLSDICFRSSGRNRVLEELFPGVSPALQPAASGV